MSGDKLVPVEPTAEMIEAAASCVTKPDDLPPIGEGWTMSDLAFRTRYRAAVSAAPVHGEPVGEVRFELGAPSVIYAELYSETLPSLAPGTKLYAATQPEPSAPAPTFQLGDHVRKTKGSQWKGRVVGTYSTSLTPEGYAVESDTEKGSVQIYPVGALELVGEDSESGVDVLVEALEWIAGADCDPGEGATDFAVAMGRGIAIGNIHRKAAEALAAHHKQEPGHDKQ